MATQAFWTARGISGQDVVTVTFVGVSPDPAPAGTLRTLTVQANSTDHEALNAVVGSFPPGTVFTPVGGQPPGQFQWTFTY